MILMHVRLLELRMNEGKIRKIEIVLRRDKKFDVFHDNKSIFSALHYEALHLFCDHCIEHEMKTS